MLELDDTGTINLPDRPERRDAAESRRRILEEARRLFEKHGVEAVSMHAIAQAAGVGQGTLYRRYGNKGDLCFDLIKESAGYLVAEIDDYLHDTADSPAMERLDSILDLIVTFTDEKIHLMGAIRDAYCGQYRGLQFANPLYQSLHGFVTGLFSEAVAGGEIEALDPTFTADALLGVLSPSLYEFQRRERGLTSEQILSGLRRLYTTGLARESAPSHA